VYAIASRFGFFTIAEAVSNHLLSSVNLTGIPQLPDDFESVSAIHYHKLVRQRVQYLEKVVKIIKQTPLEPPCVGCPRGRFVEELFRLRLAHLVMRGTPVESIACSKAWIKAYGGDSGCEKDCVVKFISTAISRAGGELADPGTSPPQKKSILKKSSFFPPRFIS
jgi:hypothetical protein